MSTKSYSFPTMVIFICMIMNLSLFARDILIPSLPAMEMSLHTSATLIQSALTIFLVGNGVSQLLYGPLSDRYGRKPILLFGFVLCLLANFVCIFSHAGLTLWLGLMVAGLGAGVASVTSRAIACDLYQDAVLTKVFAYISMTTTMSPAMAPVLGGIIQECFGWRANFVFLVILIAVCITCLMWFLPETHAVEMKVKRFSFDDYLRVIKNPQFLTPALISGVTFSYFIIYYVVSPFIYQETLHLTPVANGLLYLLVAIAYLKGAFLAKHYATKINTEEMLYIGILCSITGALFMVILYWVIGTHVATIALPFSMIVVGTGFMTPAANKQAMTAFTDIAGTAAALLGVFRMLGAFIFAMLAGEFSVATPLPMALLLLGLTLSTLIIYKICNYQRESFEFS